MQYLPAIEPLLLRRRLLPLFGEPPSHTSRLSTDELVGPPISEMLRWSTACRDCINSSVSGLITAPRIGADVRIFPSPPSSYEHYKASSDIIFNMGFLCVAISHKITNWHAHHKLNSSANISWTWPWHWRWRSQSFIFGRFEDHVKWKLPTTFHDSK